MCLCLFAKYELLLLALPQSSLIVLTSWRRYAIWAVCLVKRCLTEWRNHIALHVEHVGAVGMFLPTFYEILQIILGSIKLLGLEGYEKKKVLMVFLDKREFNKFFWTLWEAFSCRKYFREYKRLFHILEWLKFIVQRYAFNPWGIHRNFKSTNRVEITATEWMDITVFPIKPFLFVIRAL